MSGASRIAWGTALKFDARGCVRGVAGPAPNAGSVAREPAGAAKTRAFCGLRSADSADARFSRSSRSTEKCAAPLRSASKRAAPSSRRGSGASVARARDSRHARSTSTPMDGTKRSSGVTTCVRFASVECAPSTDRGRFFDTVRSASFAPPSSPRARARCGLSNTSVSTQFVSILQPTASSISIEQSGRFGAPLQRADPSRLVRDAGLRQKPTSH